MKIGIMEISPQVHGGDDYNMYSVLNIEEHFTLSALLYYNGKVTWLYRLWNNNAYTKGFTLDYTELSEEEMFQQSVVDTIPLDVYTVQKMQNHFWSVVHVTPFEHHKRVLWDIE